MNYSVQALLGIFTVDKGKIKVLLERKQDEPYRGYWMLPTSYLNGYLENKVEEMFDEIGLPNMFYTQDKTYADIELASQNNVVGISYLCLIDIVTYNLKSISDEELELEWFDLESIPKIAYNHNVVIKNLYDSFKLKIVNSNILKILFPSDFTLPELQRIYETVLNTKIDRRNFRKKLINLGYIRSTGDMNDGYTGRPAKLYRFNDETKERMLF